MPSILVPDHLTGVLCGALVSVGRSDGDLVACELDEIGRSAFEELGILAPPLEWLLFSDVSPERLGEALSRGERGAYRVPNGPGMGKAFVAAAIRVARADGDVSEAEAMAIYAFAARLGVDVESLEQAEQSLRVYPAPEPPESVARLRRLLAKCRRDEDWEGVVASLARLVELDRRPLRQGRYLNAMGVVCTDRLAAHDRAVALFVAALREDPFADVPLAHARRILTSLGRDNEADQLEAQVERLRRREAERVLRMSS